MLLCVILTMDISHIFPIEFVDFSKLSSCVLYVEWKLLCLFRWSSGRTIPSVARWCCVSARTRSKGWNLCQLDFWQPNCTSCKRRIHSWRSCSFYRQRLTAILNWRASPWRIYGFWSNFAGLPIISSQWPLISPCMYFFPVTECTEIYTGPCIYTNGCLWPLMYRWRGIHFVQVPGFLHRWREGSHGWRDIQLEGSGSESYCLLTFDTHRTENEHKIVTGLRWQINERLFFFSSEKHYNGVTCSWLDYNRFCSYWTCWIVNSRLMLSLLRRFEPLVVFLLSLLLDVLTTFFLSFSSWAFLASNDHCRVFE